MNDLDIQKVNGLKAPVEAAITFQGKYTFAAVDINGVIGIGVAACMESDKFSRDVGSGIALARAIKYIADLQEKAWKGRAVTKEEWNKKHGKS